MMLVMTVLIQHRDNYVPSMAIKNRTTLLDSLFIFTQKGAKASISGWIVSFLIAYRKSGPSHVGYVSAGFWAGITLGRFLLVYPSHQYGEKMAVILMIIGAIAFQLNDMVHPKHRRRCSISRNFGCGPRCSLPLLNGGVCQTITPEDSDCLLSFIGALGSSGGAFFPFLTGLLAQNAGTIVLHPI